MTMIWPMYLPVVEVGGGIMSDGRDVKIPRPSTVCIAGVVEGRMGDGLWKAGTPADAIFWRGVGVNAVS